MEEVAEEEFVELNASLLRAVKRTISSRAAVVVPLWPYELEYFALADPALELLDTDPALEFEGRDALEDEPLEDEPLDAELPEAPEAAAEPPALALEPVLALKALPCELVVACLEAADPVELVAGSGVFWWCVDMELLVVASAPGSPVCAIASPGAAPSVNAKASAVTPTITNVRVRSKACEHAATDVNALAALAFGWSERVCGRAYEWAPGAPIT